MYWHTLLKGEGASATTAPKCTKVYARLKDRLFGLRHGCANPRTDPMYMARG